MRAGLVLTEEGRGGVIRISFSDLPSLKWSQILSGDEIEAQDAGLNLELINIYIIHKTEGTEKITKRVSTDTKENMRVQELR